MNLKTGVRILNTQTGTIGNIKSIDDEAGTALCVAQGEGGEEFVCALADLKTLKGRPRKMA